MRCKCGQEEQLLFHLSFQAEMLKKIFNFDAIKVHGHNRWGTTDCWLDVSLTSRKGNCLVGIKSRTGCINKVQSKKIQSRNDNVLVLHFSHKYPLEFKIQLLVHDKLMVWWILPCYLFYITGGKYRGLYGLKNKVKLQQHEGQHSLLGQLGENFSHK